MKQKGFTLIELLAVIVILAIIVFIAIPTITNTIEVARKSSAESSALGYIDAVEKQIMLEKFKNITSIKDGEYDDVVEFNKNNNIKVNGKLPTVGELTIEKGKVKDAIICINGYTVEYSSEKATVGDKCSDKITTCKFYAAGEVVFESGVSGKYDFLTKCEGDYKLELWGAQGTNYNDVYQGGLGGYTAGTINLNKKTQLFIYVGEHGQDKTLNATFNGGGKGTDYADGNGYQIGYSGGGATDVRLVDGAWDNFESLKSRIMVAGAGGSTGALHSPNKILASGVVFDIFGISGEGGGLQGGDGSNALPDTENYGKTYASTGGTQTLGGYSPYEKSYSTTTKNNGGFGYGGYNKYLEGNLGGIGGGSGYYGAGGSTRGHGGSGGGSSFISGYSGCNAIDESSTENNIIHTNQPNHYSGKVFTNSIMIDGKGCNWSTGSATNCGTNQPQPNGTNAVGHYGNGYARITYIG